MNAQPAPQVRFAPPAGFQAELRARVEEYFARNGCSERGGFRLVMKALIILGWAVASYILLVFVVNPWPLVVLCALSLALAIAAIGFNIQHDGGHGAFSERKWLNALTALTLDGIGGSSYVWRFKHNVFHHSYTNVADVDDDINLGPLGRLSPAQKRYWWHRFQQYYIWPLYGFVALKWQLVDDFVHIAQGRIGSQKFPRPRGWNLVGVIAGKLLFLTVAFVIPALRHPLWKVLLLYGTMMVFTGFVLAIIFQLAHTVREAQHPVLLGDIRRVGKEWAIHQIETTVDFARNNRVLSWFIGGLNFQIEHHLFARISHLHYPQLAQIVEDVSRRFGVRYTAHRSFFAAVASHFRFLRDMGRDMGREMSDMGDMGRPNAGTA